MPYPTRGPKLRPAGLSKLVIVQRSPHADRLRDYLILSVAGSACAFEAVGDDGNLFQLSCRGFDDEFVGLSFNKISLHPLTPRKTTATANAYRWFASISAGGESEAATSQ